MSGWKLVDESAVLRVHQQGGAALLELEAELQSELAVSGDHEESVAAFREKRQPMFRGFDAREPAGARS